MIRRYCLLALVALCGCFLHEQRLEGVPEGPESWRVGYADGCTTGRLDALGHGHFIKDKDRFRVDDLYHDGWVKGHDACYAAARSGEASTETPTETELPSTATVTAAATATRPSVAETPPVSKNAPTAAGTERRTEVEQRIKDVRSELETLEKELKELPK